MVDIEDKHKNDVSAATMKHYCFNIATLGCSSPMTIILVAADTALMRFCHPSQPVPFFERCFSKKGNVKVWVESESSATLSVHLHSVSQLISLISYASWS